MANSIVGGLFGIDPTQMMQQRQAEQEVSAFRQAQLDPYQQITYNAARLGQQFGDVAAPLLGVEDPQLKAAGIAQKLAGQFQTGTVDGLMKLSEALRAEAATTGNMQLANMSVMAMERARKLEEAQVETGLKRAQTVKALQENKGSPENQAEQVILNKLTAQFGPEQGALAFADWKQNQSISRARAGAPTTILPGGAKLTDLETAMSITGKYTDEPGKRLFTVGRIGTWLNKVKAGNTTAVPQLNRELVKLAGDNQISAKEVNDILGSAGFAGNVVEGVNNFLTGKPTNVRLDELGSAIKAIENNYAIQYNKGRDKAGRILSNSKLDPRIIQDVIPPPYNEQEKGTGNNLSDTDLINKWSKR